MEPNELRRADLTIRMAFWLLAGSAALTVGLNFFILNESWLAPVVDKMVVTAVKRSADTITIRGELRLLRNCRFEDMALYAGDARNSNARPERLLFSNRPAAGGMAADDGVIEWGPWKIERPMLVTGPHLFMRLSYRCNGLWTSTSTVIIGHADDLFEPDPGP